MTQQALPPSLPLILSADDKNEAIRDVAKESAERIEGVIDEVWESGLLATVLPQKPRERYQMYRARTLLVDLPLLGLPDYVEAFKFHEVPALQSPMWLKLFSVPVVFRKVQKDFMRLLNAEAKKEI